MNSTPWLWRTVGLSVLASTLLCGFGFAYAVKEIMYPEPVSQVETGEAPITQTKPKEIGWENKTQIRIVGLGDSLTSGTGDLTGKGYIGGVRDKLEKQLNKPVFVYNNLAIPGYRTDDLIRDMNAKRDMEQAVSEADLVLLTIGGNDLFNNGQGIFNSGQGEGFNPQAAVERIPAALKNLEVILDRLAKANPKAKILYVGLYHPFLDLDEKREAAPIIQRWNTAAFELANKYPNISVVPTYDLFEQNLNKYLYTDHFHPNKDGYDRLAQRIADILS